jgi:hypothetical protein
MAVRQRVARAGLPAVVLVRVSARTVAVSAKSTAPTSALEAVVAVVMPERLAAPAARMVAAAVAALTISHPSLAGPVVRA